MGQERSARRARRWLRVQVSAGGLFVMLGVVAAVTAAAPPEDMRPPRLAAAKPDVGPRIEIKQHKYSPATLTVPVGTPVTWINRDEDVHTVTSSAQAFTSRGIDTDETFTYTFTKPGTYVYFCTLHPLMTATIVVK